MQRWFFLEDKPTDDCDEVAVSSFRTRVGRSSGVPSETGTSDTKEWTFTVVMNQLIATNEVVALSGSCSSLGNWDPYHCVLMTPILGNLHSNYNTNSHFSKQARTRIW